MEPTHTMTPTTRLPTKPSRSAGPGLAAVLGRFAPCGPCVARAPRRALALRVHQDTECVEGRCPCPSPGRAGLRVRAAPRAPGPWIVAGRTPPSVRWARAGGCAEGQPPLSRARDEERSASEHRSRLGRCEAYTTRLTNLRSWRPRERSERGLEGASSLGGLEGRAGSGQLTTQAPQGERSEPEARSESGARSP
jgi:hypothetical protein